MRAEAEFKREGNVSVPLARVPGEVRQFFDARPGDTLVFEEGSAAVAEKAALRGPYVVVRLERAERPVPFFETTAGRVLEAAYEGEEAAPAAPVVESFAEAVRRRLSGEGR